MKKTLLNIALLGLSFVAQAQNEVVSAAYFPESNPYMGQVDTVITDSLGMVGVGILGAKTGYYDIYYKNTTFLTVHYTSLFDGFSYEVVNADKIVNVSDEFGVISVGKRSEIFPNLPMNKILFCDGRKFIIR